MIHEVNVISDLVISDLKQDMGRSLSSNLGTLISKSH